MVSGLETVVVGFDGSEPSGRALDRALNLTSPSGRVVVVTAIDVGGPGARRIGEATPEGREEGEALLAEARSRAGTHGRQVETLLGEGPPAPVILHTARDLGAQLLVVGTRGAGALDRLLLGSVSSTVVQQARCDVLVVR